MRAVKLENANTASDFQQLSMIGVLTDLEFPIWPYGFVLYVASLLLTGYHVYASNQALQLPLVYLLNDNSLYANDPFAMTLPSYPSLLWRIVALCYRFIALEPLLLTFFLLERLLTIYAAGRLALAFNPRAKLAAVGAMALFALAAEPILGAGDFANSYYFEQTGLAIPVFMLAAVAFYEMREVWWAVWLAVGFNLNCMYGTYALTYFAVAFLLDPSYRSVWKRWAFPVALFLLLASPAIVFTALAFERSSLDNDLWLAASRIRFPHHLYPLTWEKRRFIKFTLLIFLFLALPHQNKVGMKKLFTHGVAWTAVSVGWLLYAFVAAYVLKWPSMLVMHPARGTDLWYCFAGVALIAICAGKVTENGKNRHLAVAVFLASIFWWYPGASPTLICSGLIALMWQPFWRYGLREGSPNRVALLLTFVILLLGGSFLGERLGTNGGGILVVPPDPVVREVADWARDTTPIGATFLVNPNWEMFRTLSKRPVFVTWKDGSAILWDRSFVGEWVKRLAALHFDITPGMLLDRSVTQDPEERLGKLYAGLTDYDIKRLQERFSIHYWVVPVTQASSFPIAFEDRSYKVLDLR